MTASRRLSGSPYSQAIADIAAKLAARRFSTSGDNHQVGRYPRREHIENVEGPGIAAWSGSKSPDGPFPPIMWVLSLISRASTGSTNPLKWVLSATLTAPGSLLAVTADGEKRTRSTSLAFAAETQTIVATTIKLQFDEITTHPSKVACRSDRECA